MKTVNKSSRCVHRTKSGRRCRLAVVPDSKFCQRHTAPAPEPPEVDLTDQLTDGLDEFTSAGPINKFLSRLLLLLASNRISPRRAAVLAYITTQILRTIAAIEAAAAKEPVEVEYIIPFAGPNYDEPGEPKPQPVPQPAGAAATSTITGRTGS